MEYWSVEMVVPLPSVILPEVLAEIEKARFALDDADYLIMDGSEE